MRRWLSFHRWALVGAVGLSPGCATWDRQNLGPPPAIQSVAEAQNSSNVEWKSAATMTSEAPLQQVAAQERPTFQKEPAKPPAERKPFQLPTGLPGADAPPIVIPSLKGLSAAEREKKVRELYPDLPAIADVPKAEMPETGKPYSLQDLQTLALQKNPAIRRASADVDAASGTMIQAGLYPNPQVGYQGDQIQPGPGPKNNAGQQGAFLQQLIKTAGKLSLARQAAGMNYSNAQVAMRRSEVDVVSQVRTNYFAVLIAEETLRVSRAMANLADEVYGLQIKLVTFDDFFSYEPLQLYAQAIQARNGAVVARNHYVAAWKQLAASLGVPELPPMQLAGRADASVPKFEAEAARRRMLESHTAVLTAQNNILRSQYQLRLAEVTPIPDLLVGTAVQHDNTVGNNQFNLQLGIALPIFDRNQGGIRTARANMARALEDLRANQNDLLGRFAEAFSRYQTSQTLVANYRERILPNLSRSYRAIYDRYQAEQKVGFNDVVVAQQNLAQALSAYLTALGDQWAAVVDIANLLQLDDLEQPVMDETGAEPKK